MRLANILTNFVPKSMYPTIKEYITITFGLILVSCGWKWFIIPHEIADDDATDFSTIIQFGFGIPIFVTYFVINSVLIVLAIRQLGWAFSIKTIFAVVVLTIAFALNPQLVDIKDPFMSKLGTDRQSVIAALDQLQRMGYIIDMTKHSCGRGSCEGCSGCGSSFNKAVGPIYILR